MWDKAKGVCHMLEIAGMSHECEEKTPIHAAFQVHISGKASPGIGRFFWEGLDTGCLESDGINQIAASLRRIWPFSIVMDTT